MDITYNKYEIPLLEGETEEERFVRIKNNSTFDNEPSFLRLGNDMFALQGTCNVGTSQATYTEVERARD